jgi:hypothetical protein
MSNMLYARYALTAALMFCALAPALTQAQTATAPDSTLYTSYTVSSSLQSVDWIVCGSTTETDGCYASGSLGTFGRVGAMLESQPVVSGNSVTREIYVLDIATGSAATGVSLFVYTKTDVVSALSDQVTVTPIQTISLPLVGGSSVTASMAANSSILYVGTNQSTQAVSIVKDVWTVATVGGFSPPITVASITANSYGYVTLTFGTPGGQFSGFYVFGPTGASVEDGGGPDFILDNLNAVVPVPLPF